MTLSIDDINAAFTPKIEIKEPKHFVGRYEEIKQCLNFLNTEGAFLVIYGLRGLGKSSLANQIKIIGEGNQTLLTLCHLTKFAKRSGYNYFVHIVRCDDYVKDVPSLIKRIILGDDCNESLYSYLKNDVTKIEKALEYFAKRDNIVNDTVDETNYLSEDLIQIFRQSLSVIRKHNQEKDGVIILIDEFDLVANKFGFASLIKSITSEHIKFGVIGIADDIHDLVQNHASIARQIEPVEVGLMNEEELKMIIHHAEVSVKQRIRFSEAAKQLIVERANGFPYYVHLIGKEAFSKAFERDFTLIEIDLIDECVEQIKSGLSSSIHEKNYVLAANSPAREKVLRYLAQDKRNLSLVEEVYTDIKELYLIEKPSAYVKELVEVNEGTPIIKFVNNGRFVRFIDPLFKLYITMRDPQFSESK